MGKIRLIVSIDCEDEDMAIRVQEEFMPNLNELLQVDGIFGVKAEWLAERMPDRSPVGEYTGLAAEQFLDEHPPGAAS
jgi:hypothetical protein